MALDRARLKERLADALLAERAKRGGGDARRFPQPKMAELLGYSLRQYQRLEDPADTNLPSWENLDAIAEKLDLDAAALFADPEPEREPVVTADERLDRLEAGLAGVQRTLGELAAEIRRGDGPAAAVPPEALRPTS